MSINNYFKDLEKSVVIAYNHANIARKQGFDPSDSVEIPVATSLAERVLGLISVLYPQIMEKKIVTRIQELEKQHGPLDPAVSLSIAEEIAKEKFCKFKSHLEAMEAGIRVAIGYLTLGYVSSPIEGFIQLKIKKTATGQDYLAPYFSGPIRSAGGTEEAFSLVIVDYLRELFGYAKYDSTEEEVKRGIHECYEYHERITNLQYLPSEKELEFLLKNVPVQISGDASEEREVYNYKDLPRIETNFLRSGFCLVTAEGLAQKAPKVAKRISKLIEKGYKLSDWGWLEDFVRLQKKLKESKKSDSSRAGATYIQDIVGGRPVFSHPSQSGGFRLRYGRCRNTGYSTLAIHPATMAVTNNFIAVGTQLKIEKPTKGCTVASCDDIDGPIVLLNDGSVKILNNVEETIKLQPRIKEIIYLGDILVPYGDFLNRNYSLERAGYVPQYWLTQLKKAGGESSLDISFDKAIDFSQKFDIPLHPNYIFFWKEISYEQFLGLLDWISHGILRDDVLALPFSKTHKERFVQGKRALELLGCEHSAALEDILIKEPVSTALLFNIGISLHEPFDQAIDRISIKLKTMQERNVLEIVNKLSSLKISDKSGTFIGARMGRPEKAKLRKLTGSPHVLFPVGEEGGRMRSVMSAVEKGVVRGDFPNYFCTNCKRESIYSKCDTCRNPCILEETEPQSFGEKVERSIDVVHYLENARKHIGMRKDEIPTMIKGVRGTSNKEHVCEHLSKGLLRAKYGLNVNKDGTIRYDMTEMPLTHFRPLEIGTSVEKLRTLGYITDIYGSDLKNDNQILELLPHDIILPACPISPDERADDVFMNVANFVDEELQKLYKTDSFFNVKKREDLVGALFGCMSPHTSAVALGRLIGFSKIQALLASPYIHAAMRRDCFSYDSYMPVKVNGFWKNRKIGEIVEELRPEKVVDAFGTKEIEVKEVKTVGFDGKVKEIDVNNFSKHTKREMFEIKTALGKKISVTENHKFLVNNKIKTAAHLRIGDELPCPIKISIAEKDIDYINLAEFLDGTNFVIRGVRNIINSIPQTEIYKVLALLRISRKQFTNFKLRNSYPLEFIKKLDESIKDKIYSVGKISQKRDRIAIPVKITLTDELLEVIGLYVAEGYSRTVRGSKGLNQVYIANNDQEILAFVRKVIFKHFGLVISEKKNDRATFSSSLFYMFMTKVLEAGSLAKDKRVPYVFLSLPKRKLACFLRGYFEGDGSAEKKRMKVCCDSVSEGLLHDLEFCLSRFGIFTKRYEYEKEPGQPVRAFYEKKGKGIPTFKITKLIIGSDFINNFIQIGFLSQRKNAILEGYKKMKPYGMKIKKDANFVYDPIIAIESLGKKESYCLNVASSSHLVVVNSLVSKQCDGDEAAVMLLMDLLLNFSRKFIPSHRGGTQDAPLVLNMRIRANEVDDMIFDLDVTKEIPYELYLAAENHKHPTEVKLEQIKNRLGGDKEFTNLMFSYDTSDLNKGALCSSYKTLPTMQEKVDGMMHLCKKIRAVDASDVARLIIERHFIRDTRGNLRKFSQQGFRCVACNSKFRRPPLVGKCTSCGGKIIFTISEGSILKYMQPALDLARNYNVSPYLLESLELTQSYIESIFGKDKETQEGLNKWF